MYVIGRTEFASAGCAVDNAGLTRHQFEHVVQENTSDREHRRTLVIRLAERYMRFDQESFEYVARRVRPIELSDQDTDGGG
ncbi:MAG: hypothetical protein DMF86_21560 [Acidobacteria bacterium]|nr:MAG: hypothetical protein DMF86_21560 [Acidobacteriota bacterium]